MIMVIFASKYIKQISNINHYASYDNLADEHDTSSENYFLEEREDETLRPDDEVVSRDTRSTSRAQSQTWTASDLGETVERDFIFNFNKDVEIRDPLSYAKDFLTDEFLTSIVEQSNLYATQC